MHADCTAATLSSTAALAWPSLIADSIMLQRLMAAMKRNKVLLSLDLGYCYLGRNGGKEIAGRTGLHLSMSADHAVPVALLVALVLHIAV